MKTITYILVFLLMIGLVSAYPSECEARGGYIYCTGLLDSGDFDMGGKSLFLEDATVRVIGASVASSANGINAVINISNANKVKIINTSLYSRGGTGGSGDSDINPNGGNGGNAGLSIDASSVYLENITVDFLGGNGGAGDANSYRWEDDDRDYHCEGPELGYGGYPGETIINIVSDTLDLENVTGSSIGALAGIHDVDACASARLWRDDVDARGIPGYDGATPVVTFNSSTTILNMLNLTITGGNGRQGVTDDDSITNGGESNEMDSIAVNGGVGGASNINIDTDNLELSNVTFTITTGTPASGDSDIVKECSGDDTDNDYDEAAGKDALQNYFNINTDTGILNNLVVITTSGNGGDAITTGGYCSGTGTSDDYRTAARGGDAAGSILSIICSDSCTGDTFDIDLFGGNGGTADHDSYDKTTEQGSRGGHGGSNNITLYNINVSNLNIYGVGGIGHNYDNDDVGGNGGYTYLYSTNLIVDTGNITLVGGNGGNGGVAQSIYGTGAGSGGTAALELYGNTKFDSTTIDIDGGSVGTGTYCYNTGDWGYGGDGTIYNFNSTEFISSDINLSSGGGACHVTGNALFTSDVSTRFNTVTFYSITGTETITSPSVPYMSGIFYNNTFVSKNSDIDVATNGGLTDIQNFDGYQVSIFELYNTDVTGTTIFAKYFTERDLYKLMTYGSTATDTLIVWVDDYDIKYYNNSAGITTSITDFGSGSTVSYPYNEYLLDVLDSDITYGTIGGPYADSVYYCNFNTYYDSDYVTIYGGIKAYNDGTLTDRIPLKIDTNNYTYEVDFDGVTIGDNVTCEFYVFDDTLVDYRSVINTSDIVTPTYPINLKIDVGNNGIYDYNVTGVFDTTEGLDLSTVGLNTFLNYCDETVCSVPIRFSSDSYGKLITNEIVQTYGVDTINTVLIDLPLIVSSDSPGTVQVDSMSLSYGSIDGQTIKIEGNASGYDLDTLYMTVIQSNVSVEYPSGTEYFEVYPMYPNQQNVVPRGQTTTIPLFNITNNHPTEDVDIYVDMTESWEDQQLLCTEIEFNNPSGPLSFNINTSPQLIVDDMSTNVSEGVWTYEDFTCSSWNDLVYSLYNPVFTFRPHCSDCVITVDFADD